MKIGLKGNIIEFPNKIVELEKKRKKENILKIANFLMENCNGDFAIVMKTKDVKHLFENIQNEKFIIGLSNFEGRKLNTDEYFFRNFCSHQYFNLDNK